MHEEIRSISEFKMWLNRLTQVVLEVIESKIPKMSPVPHQKWWWSKELTTKQKAVHRLTCKAYGRRVDPEDPAHLEANMARYAYGSMIECAKKWHWEDFLESVDKMTVLTAHWYVSGDPTDRGKARVPTLKMWSKNGTKGEVVSNEEKSRAFCEVFFPKPGPESTCTQCTSTHPQGLNMYQSLIPRLNRPSHGWGCTKPQVQMESQMLY